MKYEEKQVLVKKFLENKNIIWEECSNNQKKVFNDWPPERWHCYDWELLSNKSKNN